ncbi:MAG: hypothetical protein ACFE89_09800 [Candidatus Hodarchaeota archaeon]
MAGTPPPSEPSDQPPAQPPVQPPAQPEAKPLAPDQCPRCRSEVTTILRKTPIAYGHELTRKCDKCGNIWTYKSKFGAGAWP